MIMMYSMYYPHMFGPNRKKPTSAKPAVEEANPVALVEVPAVEEVVEAVVIEVDVEDKAKQLAADYTKTELKAMADDYGLDYKSNIRELALATLIAEYQIQNLGAEE